MGFGWRSFEGDPKESPWLCLKLGSLNYGYRVTTGRQLVPPPTNGTGTGACCCQMAPCLSNSRACKLLPGLQSETGLSVWVGLLLEPSHREMGTQGVVRGWKGPQCHTASNRDLTLEKHFVKQDPYLKTERERVQRKRLSPLHWI